MMSDYWKEELQSLPMSITVSHYFISNFYFQKKGKMVALLKQKSKVILERKPRTKYEVKNIFKRAKTDSSITKEAVQNLNKTIGFNSQMKTPSKITPKYVEKYDADMKQTGQR